MLQFWNRASRNHVKENAGDSRALLYALERAVEGLGNKVEEFEPQSRGSSVSGRQAPRTPFAWQRGTSPIHKPGITQPFQKQNREKNDCILAGPFDQDTM